MSSSDSIPVSPAQLALHVAGRNTAEAIRLLQQLVDDGNIEACLLLGQLYLDGRDLPPQEMLAVALFQKAAHAGNAMGLNMLGRCHEHGWGIEKYAQQAAHCYQQASQLGLDWGHYNWANLLATGRGVAQNQAQAFALYLKAAHAGHAKSMNLVGRYYQEGIAVIADEKTAAEWYLRSAQAGDFRGQISLAGVLVEQGQLAEALAWLKKAIQTGNAAALSKLYPDLLKMPHAEFRELAAVIQKKLGISA